MENENTFTQTTWKMKRIILFWRNPQPTEHLGAGHFNFEHYIKVLEARK